MGKRQEAAKLTRTAIVEAAAKLQREKGLSNVSIDEIVAEAGVSKGSFYTYFKRKEDIAVETSFDNFDGIKKRLPAASAGAAVRIGIFLKESVRLIVETGVETCKDWMKAAVSPVNGDCNGMRKLVYDREFILEELRRGKELEAGEGTGDREGTGAGKSADAVTAEELADIITAEYYGNVALWSMTDGAFPIEERTKQYADGILPRMLEDLGG